MTADVIHQPTPEFRDYLEDEVARAFRRHRGAGRGRVAALLGVALALGASGSLATAQLRDGARRDSLLAAATADAAMVAVRLDLARAVAADVGAKVRSGVLAPASLAAAEADLRAVEAQAMRARLNIDEIRASAQPPRDELNAPLVDGRDFVLARLQLDLLGAQQRLGAAERALEETARRVRVGAEGELSAAEAELAVARARAALGALAERQTLRREFVERGTAGDQLVRRLRQAELRLDAHVAQQAVRLAQERLALARRQHAIGHLDQIELLRAELALRERELELQLLARELQQLGRAGDR